MKSTLSVTVVVCTWALCATAIAQGPGRKPGAEHARIGYFAGQWKIEGVSEGMKYTSNMTCDSFAGGFHHEKSSRDLVRSRNEVVHPSFHQQFRQHAGGERIGGEPGCSQAALASTGMPPSQSTA